MFKLTYKMVGFPGVEAVDGVWNMPTTFSRAVALVDTGEVSEVTVAPADPEDAPGYHASVTAASERMFS